MNDKNDQYWIEYRDALVLANTSPSTIEKTVKPFYQDDFIAGEVPSQDALWTPLSQTETIKEAVKLLGVYVKPDGIELLRVRFRSHKYRKSKQKKTLQINRVTHQKILDFTKDIEAETVDEALDYLFSRKYNQEVQEAIELHSERTYEEDETFLSRLLERVGKRDRNRITLSIEDAFRAGWDSAKRSRTKNSSEAKAISIKKYVKQLFNTNF